MPAWAYAGYSFGAAGVANFLADKVAANANLKGLDIKIGSKGNDVLIQITRQLLRKRLLVVRLRRLMLPRLQELMRV
jgi:hypothetical protein